MLSLPRQSPNQLSVPKSCCKETFCYLITIPLWSQLKQLTTDWDLSLCGWDPNPAKSHSTWFQDLVKLRFLMSRGRKNSVRDQAVGKRWLYSDTESTLHTERGHRRGWVRPRSAAWLVFTGWVSSHASEREDCAKCSGEGQRSPGFGPWSFNSALELSWRLRPCHLTCCSRIKVSSCLPSRSRLILISLCCVLGPCDQHKNMLLVAEH